MKRIIVPAIVAIACMAPACVYANPDITDLLKDAAQKMKDKHSGSDSASSGSSTALSGLKGALEGMLAKSDITEADLVGNYAYSAPAVSLKSDNALQKLGGSAATGVIVEKLAPYYQKAGLQNLTATFNDDGTCEFRVKKAVVTGTYAKAEDGSGFVFKFKAIKKIPFGTMNAMVQKVGSKVSITFDATKLIQLVNAVANVSGKASLQSAAKVLNSYDGLYAGFELTPTGTK